MSSRAGDSHLRDKRHRHAIARVLPGHADGSRVIAVDDLEVLRGELDVVQVSERFDVTSHTRILSGNERKRVVFAHAPGLRQMPFRVAHVHCKRVANRQTEEP